MAKVTSKPDSAFWTAQRSASFRLTDNIARRAIGYAPRRVSRGRREMLGTYSVVPFAAKLWAGTETSDKNDWISAGSGQGLTGYQAFLQRVAFENNKGAGQFGVSDYGATNYGFGWTDSNLFASAIAHYKGGRVDIAAPAPDFLLYQEHLEDYNIRRVALPSKRVFEISAVTDVFSVPFNFGLSVNIDNLSLGPNAVLIFGVSVKYTENNVVHTLDKHFDISTANGWTNFANSIATFSGIPISYKLYFQISDCTGFFLFDNINAKHDGSNYAIDPNCNNIAPDIKSSWGNVAVPWLLSEPSSLILLSTDYVDDLTN